MATTQGCLNNIRNPIINKTKQIDVRHHFVREHVAQGGVEFKQISSKQMVVDGLTKAVSPQKHRFCMKGMGLVHI